MLNAKHAFSAMAAVLTLLLLGGPAEAGIVVQEDFESGTATGWTDNTVTDSGHVDFTKFLGRFAGTGGNQGVSKTFALSGLQPEVTVQFDFFQLDSWDNERFRVYIDDAQLANDLFSHGGTENPANATPMGPNSNQVFSRWNDQRFRYEFTVPVSDTDIKLGFGSTLNSSISDESWGIDNVVIKEDVEAARARLDQAAAGRVTGAAYAENIVNGDVLGPVDWKIQSYGLRNYSDGILNEWFNNESHTSPTIVDPFLTDSVDWTSGNYPAETGWSGNHDHFSVKYTGQFYADHDGDYSFLESADDETWLVVDGTQILHDTTWNVDTPVTISLSEGWHDIEYRTREGSGGDFAQLYWDPTGTESGWELMTVDNALLSYDGIPSVGWQPLEFGSFNVGGPASAGDFGVHLPYGIHRIRLTATYDGTTETVERVMMIPEPAALLVWLLLAGLGIAAGWRRGGK